MRKAGNDDAGQAGRAVLLNGDRDRARGHAIACPRLSTQPRGVDRMTSKAVVEFGGAVKCHLNMCHRNIHRNIKLGQPIYTWSVTTLVRIHRQNGEEDFSVHFVFFLNPTKIAGYLASKGPSFLKS